ncbi:MAG: glycosyltransferase family 4 protein [Verrucomicrobia bacterium]|nr:glycosyltransferase family 4 protein [Verrucomicrobiota bacterium]
MRLGLVYHQFVPRGGLEGYLIEFASRLAAAGHELEIVTANIAPEVESKIKATWHRIPLIQGSPLLRMWQFDRAAAQLISDLPVDASIGFGRTTTQDLHRAGGGCHRVYSDLLPAWKRWNLKNRLELHLEKQLYTSGRTKRFITNSAQVASQLHSAYGTDKSLFRVIHTAVDSERFRPAQDRATLRTKVCEQLRCDASRPAFMFVSLSHRRKGLDVLLDIWPEVDADLWIVGNAPSAHHVRKIRKLGIEKKIRCIAAQSNLTSLYQTADWFVHPTLYDACANTVLQSMACGLPGLISVNDGAIDFMRDGQNGYLLGHPQEAVAVLATVRRALGTNAEERAALGVAARETMLPLTWEAHLSKWFDALNDINE